MRSLSEIDAARQAAGMTKKRLYMRAGIHHSTYARNLRGERKPNLSTLERLDGALDALLAEREAAE